MTKFVGKFRKNSEYTDDYKSMNVKEKQRNEHGEIKKVLFREMQEGYEYDDLDEYDVNYK